MKPAYDPNMIPKGGDFVSMLDGGAELIVR